jgi:hypothetical protein
MDDPFLRDVRSPVTASAVAATGKKCRTVQFCDPLTDADHRKVARVVSEHPQVRLRVYGNYFQNATWSSCVITRASGTLRSMSSSHLAKGQDSPWQRSQEQGGGECALFASGRLGVQVQSASNTAGK